MVKTCLDSEGQWIRFRRNPSDPSLAYCDKPGFISANPLAFRSLQIDFVENCFIPAIILVS